MKINKSSQSPNWGTRFRRPLESGIMKISSGGKSARQMEKISTVGRLNHIENFGKTKEDIEMRAKWGNGVEGEKFIELYKQINEEKVSNWYSRKIIFSKLHRLLIYYLAQKSSLEQMAGRKRNGKMGDPEEGDTGKKFRKM
jgi:hypothetical protein